MERTDLRVVSDKILLDEEGLVYVLHHLRQWDYIAGNAK